MHTDGPGEDRMGDMDGWLGLRSPGVVLQALGGGVM